MSDYTTVGGDSLPGIAEAYGHAGEWQAIALLNEGVWTDYNNLQPGLELTLPAEWIHDPEIEPPSTTSKTSTSTTTSTRSTSSSSTT